MNENILNYSQYENKYNFNYSQYKKTINKKNNSSFYFIFFLIILLLGLCVLLAPKPINYDEFFYVEIDNFQTYKEAIKLSQEIKESGGAGYIYFDGTYHVLASFYSSSNDAEKVVENLTSDYENAEVFSLNCKRFKHLKNLTSGQNSSIKNLIDTSKEIIFKLEDLSIKFEKNEITFNETTIHIKNLLKSYNSTLDDFFEQFKTNSKFNTAKEDANEIATSLSNLINTDEQNFSTFLRYEIVNISITFSLFTNCF